MGGKIEIEEEKKENQRFKLFYNICHGLGYIYEERETH